MMKIYKPAISFKKNIDAVIAAVICFWLICTYTTVSGIGVSPDSVAYASIARYLGEGNFFKQLSDMPLFVFPFFYPTFLYSIMCVTGIDVFVSAPFVNATIFALVIFCSGVLMEQFVHRNRWYKWAILSVIVLSTSLKEIYSMLWSETLFILLLLLFFMALKKYAENHRFKFLLLAAFIAALACVTRFAGVTLIAAGGFMVLIDKELPWKKKWWQLIVFGITGISLLVANLVRNYLLEGTLTGERQKGTTPLTDNIQYAANVVWAWLQLPETLVKPAYILFVLLMIGVAIIVIKRWLAGDNFYSFENINAVFFFVYTSFIIVTATLSRYEAINNRLLSPSYISFILACTCWLPSFLNSIKQKNRQWIAVVIAFVVFCSFQYKQTEKALHWYAEIKLDGIPGYNLMAWKRSPLLYYLHEHSSKFKPGIDVYSNASDAFYFFSGMSAESLPETPHLEEIKNYYKSNPHYIVWFTNDFDDTEVVRLEEIKKHRQLDTLQSFKDGLILWSK